MKAGILLPGFLILRHLTQDIVLSLWKEIKERGIELDQTWHLTNLFLLHPELVLEQLEEGSGLLIVGEVVDRPHHSPNVLWSSLAS